MCVCVCNIETSVAKSKTLKFGGQFSGIVVNLVNSILVNLVTNIFVNLVVS